MTSKKTYVNRQGKRIFFDLIEQSNIPYSLRELKRRLRQTKSEWNVFLHLTYDNEHLSKACSDNVRKLLNNLKQYNRNKVKEFSKYPRWAKILEYYAERNKQFKYCWKLEFDSSGIRKYNPHYHILVSSSFYLSKKKIESWWQYGFVTITTINCKEQAVKYVKKYMSKNTKFVYDWKGRHFGHSRNIKPSVKEWSYEGLLPEKEAEKISILQERPLQGYLIQKELKKLKKIKPFFD